METITVDIIRVHFKADMNHWHTLRFYNADHAKAAWDALKNARENVFAIEWLVEDRNAGKETRSKRVAVYIMSEYQMAIRESVKNVCRL